MALIDVVPAVVVLCLLASDLWVYSDASSRVQRGDPVVFSVGSIQLDTPPVWAVACLFLWILCFPLYLATRKGSRNP